MKGKYFIFVCACSLLTHSLTSFAAQSEHMTVPPGAGIGVAEGYTRTEPGHWEQTDITLLMPEEATRTADNITIDVSQAESANGSAMIYRFSRYNYDVEQTYTIETFWFEDQYYGDEAFSAGINIIRTPDEDLFGGVEASLTVVGALEPDGQTASGSSEPVVYFTKDNGEDISSLTVEDMTYSTGSEGKYFIYPQGKLPVGKEDGEQIYILLSVKDRIDGGTVASRAYQYTWVKEPEEIEVPAEYGPIEYHASSLSAAPILIAAVLTAGIAIGIIALRKKKRKSRK